MKLNVSKLLYGGKSYFLATPTASPLAPASTPTQSTATPKSDTPLISEGILKELTTKGLVNDVNLFMSQLTKLQNQPSGITLSQINGLYANANKIIRGANNLKQAETIARNKSSLGDIAVDSNGFMYVFGKNGAMTKKHISKFDVKNDYAMTVADLILQREYNPTLAFDNNISTLISSTESMERINKYIKDIMLTVSSTSNTQEAYHQLSTVVSRDLINKPTDALQETIKEFASMIDILGSDAIIKVKDKVSTKNMQSACNYIFSMLPKNMQQQLYANYVANGGDIKNAPKAIMEIIFNAADAWDNKVVEHKLSYSDTMNNQDKNKTTTTKLRQLSPIELLIQGTVNLRPVTIFTGIEGKSSVTMLANALSSLTDLEGKVVGMSDLFSLMNSSMSAYTDQNHIMAGDQTLNSSDFSKMVYDGKDVALIWAPVDVNGNINTKLFLQIQDLQEKAKTQHLTVDQLNQLLRQQHLPGSFNKNKVYEADKTTMQQFIMFTALTGTDVVDPSTNVLSIKCSDQEAKNYRELIDYLYDEINNGHKHGKLEFPSHWYNHSIIKVPVFVRLAPNAQSMIGSYVGEGPTVPKSTLQDVVAYEQMPLNLYKPSTNLIFANE